MAARPGGGALAHFREERRAQVLTAEGVAQAAVARAEETQRALVLAREESQDLQQQLTAAQADFARAQGEATALQRQVEAGAEQRRELQGALTTSQQRFTQELEQQRAAAALAVERHAADTRRLLLDVDRARGNSAMLLDSWLTSTRMHPCGEGPWSSAPWVDHQQRAPHQWRFVCLFAVIRLELWVECVIVNLRRHLLENI